MRSKGFARLAAVVGGTAWCLLSAILPASAQSYPGGGTPPPTVGGEKFFRGGEGTAHTGTDILMFLVIAAIVLVIGIALVGLSRRATPSDH